jgi:thiol-disulfide isomerase/thioredoxin
MNIRETLRRVALGAVLAGSIPAALSAPHGTDPATLSGLWDAEVTIDSLQVPCKFGIQVKGTEATGWFFNGDERIVSTHGHLNSGHLVLEFDSYARTLDLTVRDDGSLDGNYLPRANSKRQPYGFHASRAPAAVAPNGESVPAIAGLWLVPAASDKAGEKAWQFIARQNGAQISAAMLRVDGDSGALTGTWHDGHALLGHFDGARPSVIDLSSNANGTLTLLLREPHSDPLELTAFHPADARTRGLPEAADPMQHTRVSNPDEPLRFSFPDLTGQVVSNADSRFQNKVVIVDVAGSWCPNCHDEAPLLEALYKKYNRLGLEIVMLSFEEAEELSDPVRLRAFVRQFGITYPVLLAGTPGDLHARLPQAVDLDAYPTTFFLGRDGRVRSIHAGFAAAATGYFSAELKRDFTARVEQLLAQPASTHAAPAVASVH